MTLNFPGDTSSAYIDPNTGLKYLFNNSIGAWETAIQPPVVVSDTDPGLNIPGFLWWDSVGGSLYVRYKDANSEQWVEAVPSGGNQQALTTVSAYEPGTPRVGELWVDISDPARPTLKVYAVIGGVVGWYTLSDPGSTYAGAYVGPAIQSSSVAPVTRKENDIWYDSDNQTLHIFHNNAWTEITRQGSGGSFTSETVLAGEALTKSGNTINARACSTTQTGVIRIATQAECNTGKSTNTAVTPGKLKNAVLNFLPSASLTDPGVIRIANVTSNSLDNDTAASPLYVANRINKVSPVGSVIAYYGEALVGYLKCDGSSVVASSYPELNTIMGNTGENLVLPNIAPLATGINYFIRHK